MVTHIISKNSQRLKKMHQDWTICSSHWECMVQYWILSSPVRKNQFIMKGSNLFGISQSITDYVTVLL